jgi:hypothetical protein
MDNQVIQATLGRRQGQKAKKVKKNTTQKTETNEQHRPHKKPRRNPGDVFLSCFTQIMIRFI